MKRILPKGRAGPALAALALIIRHVRRHFQFVVVTGESMRPTLRHGDLIVGRRRAPSIKRGDVVVFEVRPSDYPDRDPAGPSRRVKRIVAVGGDAAPAFVSAALKSRYDDHVPAGYVALAGDAPVSEGSAQFGYIGIDRVESVVVKRLRSRPPTPAD